MTDESANEIRVGFTVDSADRWTPLCWKGDGTPPAPALALMTKLTECVTCPSCIEWMHA